jgi:hypothetical protein
VTPLSRPSNHFRPAPCFPKPARAVVVLIGFLCCPVPSGRAQQKLSEVGNPYIRNFGSTDFNAPEATWDTIEDRRGIIYVGNQAGALEYDGVSWRLIETPKRTYIRTFAQDPKGRIFAGSSGDFGYLAPNDKGQMEFVSLLGKLAKEDRNFSDIWGTFWTPEGVYFLAPQRLFRYVDDQTPIKVWPAKPQFLYANYVRGHLYARRDGGVVAVGP